MSRLRCKIAYRLVILAKWIYPPLLGEMVEITVTHLAKDTP